MREVCKTSMNSRMGVCPSMTTHKGRETDWAVRKYTKGLINSRMRVCPSVMTHEDQEVDQVVRESANDPMNPRIGACLKAARRCKSQSAGDGWKGLYESRTTLHWELTSMKGLGIMVQRGEYNISQPSDGDYNGYVRERSPPGLNEGNMPQYDIRCTRSVPMTRE